MAKWSARARPGAVPAHAPAVACTTRRPAVCGGGAVSITRARKQARGPLGATIELCRTALLAVTAAYADVLDPLHGTVCAGPGGTNCTNTDNGSFAPLPAGQFANFGFAITPDTNGPATGTLNLVILVPTNEIAGTLSSYRLPSMTDNGGANLTPGTLAPLAGQYTAASGDLSAFAGLAGTYHPTDNEGSLHTDTAKVFRVAGQPIRLHRHQEQAVAKSTRRQSFVVTTGTGSGKSLCFFIPIIDSAIRGRRAGEAHRTRAIIVYPMNAPANSQISELEMVTARILWRGQIVWQFQFRDQVGF
jgi:hypothetical protein